MASIFGVIHCLIFISIANAWVSGEPDEETKFVNVIFRHGNVTRDEFKKRANEFAKFIPLRYPDLLPEHVGLGTFEARSTDQNETKEYLKTVLKALYQQMLEPPCIKAPNKREDFLLDPFLCPQYMKEYLEAESNMTGEVRRIESATRISSLADMYKSYMRIESGNENPEFSKQKGDPSLEANLYDGTILYYKAMNYNQMLKKLNGGKLVKKFIEDMKSVENGTMPKKRKIALYSANDVNIVAVLEALGVFSKNFPRHVPQFSSAVFVSLHRMKKSLYVDITYYYGGPSRYNNKENKREKQLRIPKCGYSCPLSTFLTLMKNVTPTESELQCSNVPEATTTPSKPTTPPSKPTTPPSKPTTPSSKPTTPPSKPTTPPFKPTTMPAKGTKFVSAIFYYGPVIQKFSDKIEEEKLNNFAKFIREKYKGFLLANDGPETLEVQSAYSYYSFEYSKTVLKALYPQTYKNLTEHIRCCASLVSPAALQYLSKYGKVEENFNKTVEDLSSAIYNSSDGKIISLNEMHSDHLLYKKNISLPGSRTLKTSPLLEDHFYNATLSFYEMMNYNEKLKMLNGGIFLKTFIEDMKSVENGTMPKDRKIALYSTEDLNIVSVLAALGVFSKDFPLHMPQLSSAVIVTLHRKINEPYTVEVTYYYSGSDGYNNKENKTEEQLRIPGCESSCPLNKFINLMKNVTPTKTYLKCSDPIGNRTTVDGFCY